VFVPVGAATGVARGRKNVPTATAAFALLRKKRPDVKLIIASNGIIHPAMLVELLGPEVANAGVMRGQAWHSADGSIRVEPDLARAAFLSAMAHARAIFYPSRYEGFGLPSIEAMALEVPLAAAAATSIPEVVGDAGVLFDPDDPAAIAATLERVLSDEFLRSDLIARGRKRVKPFTAENFGKATRAVYESAVGR
jgi:glycosyltransferase involved in cell wall biosynthesis